MRDSPYGSVRDGFSQNFSTRGAKIAITKTETQKGSVAIQASTKTITTSITKPERPHYIISSDQYKN